MPSVDSFSASVTNVQLNCPPDVTGLERIMLAAQGDLQRLLSAFFAQPIVIKRIYANTSIRERPASPDNHITQERQVHLVCADHIVCVATSHVTITNAECERLFLDEGFAIGQLFRQLRRVPEFELLSVNATIHLPGARRELRRRYKLAIDGFECEIEEVFPDRDMFVRCEAWLYESDASSTHIMEKNSEEVSDNANSDNAKALVKHMPSNTWTWLSPRRFFPSWIVDRF